MAAEWPAARGASVQREGRSPCSRRLGAAPRSPSSVTGGEKAPRAPPALLLAAGTARGPRHSRRNCCARPIARLLVLLLTCAPHGAVTGETPRTLQIETRKLRSTAPGLPPAASRAPAPTRPGGASKKGKGNGEGFFFFSFSFYLKKHELPGSAPSPESPRLLPAPGPPCRRLLSSLSWLRVAFNSTGNCSPVTGDRDARWAHAWPYSQLAK